MNRLLTALLAILTLLVVVPVRALAADQPGNQTLNILFIFCDDHAYQAISAYGFGLTRISRMAVDFANSELSFGRTNQALFRHSEQEVRRIQWVKVARTLFGWVLTVV